MGKICHFADFGAEIAFEARKARMTERARKPAPSSHQGDAKPLETPAKGYNLLSSHNPESLNFPEICWDAIPRGRWAIGVSGGSDSVALLRLVLRFRPDVEPVVAHLNHALRPPACEEDEIFVANLCRTLGVPCIARRMSEQSPIPASNLEARLRAARLDLFASVVNEFDASGVLLAHHADDRAETTLLRLLRGTDPLALDALRVESKIGGLRIMRPLLLTRRTALEQYLRSIGQPWRVDESNASDQFARNRARKLLKRHPHLTDRLLALADASGAFRDSATSTMPAFDRKMPCPMLADLPNPFARLALRHWLRKNGIRVDAIAPAQLGQLLNLARDRASPPVVPLPGGRYARRLRQEIVID